MEAVLWQVLAGTRGGPNRARLLRAIAQRPRNANQLAETLDLDYKTITHHLDVLSENDVARSTNQPYGAVWLPSERARENWDTVAAILDQLEEVDTETEDLPNPDPTDPPSTERGTE